MQEPKADSNSAEKGRHSTTVNLALQAQSLDYESCTLLCERLTPALLAWARLRVPRGSWKPVEPEDVVQEVWLRALSRLDSFDPSKGTFRMWMFGIAGRALLDLLRRAIRGSAAGSDSSTEDPFVRVADDATAVSTRLCRSESFQLVAQRLAALGEEERRLIIYRGLEGLPHEEVAKRLGIGVEAATKRGLRLRSR
jgi:RNA polymerase sigma-70 factor (ECF subfamily)